MKRSSEINDQHGKLTFEYNQITKNIFIGTNMCCITHFDKSLVEKKITADISLQEKKLDQPFGAKYYCWLPTKDHTPPSVKQLKVGVNFLKSLIDNHEKVYVHCRRGHGRAPTLVAAYLISTGISLKDAINIIKNKRPTAHLETSQINALRKWEKKHKK
jgi:protein-tyrosine phosphatase